MSYSLSRVFPSPPNTGSPPCPPTVICTHLCYSMHCMFLSLLLYYKLSGGRTRVSVILSQVWRVREALEIAFTCSRPQGPPLGRKDCALAGSGQTRTVTNTSLRFRKASETWEVGTKVRWLSRQLCDQSSEAGKGVEWCGNQGIRPYLLFHLRRIGKL